MENIENKTMEYLRKMFSLEGKNIVITGGAGSIGSKIAEGFGKSGARIAICARRNYDQVAEKLQKKKIDARGYYIDVLNKPEIEKCCSKVINDFKRIDVLLNAVGGNIPSATTSKQTSFFELPLEEFEKVVALNLFGGAILPCQVFGKSMVNNKNGGSIINISSMSAFKPLTKIPGYSAAKSAVSNFTQWLAVHFALEYNKNLRVNAIAPGFFLTKQNRFLLQDENGNLTERGKTILKHTPAGRFGITDELIGVCIWLASDASRFVTGTVIPVDGGFSAYSGV